MRIGICKNDDGHWAVIYSTPDAKTHYSNGLGADEALGVVASLLLEAWTIPNRFGRDIQRLQSQFDGGDRRVSSYAVRDAADVSRTVDALSALAKSAGGVSNAVLSKAREHAAELREHAALVVPF